TDGGGATMVGYTGGTVEDLSYQQVGSGTSVHVEANTVEFDPERVSYAELLDLFFQLHDPTQLNRQGPDVGHQYRSAVFFHSPEQEREAIAAKERAQTRTKATVVTEIV